MNDGSSDPSAWRRPPVLRRFDAHDEERRATWLELFFDLVFVVAVAELAHLLHDDPTPGGSSRLVGLFVPVWWAWMGYTFYADQFDTDDVPFRVTLLAALLGVAALAVSLSDMAHGKATGFVVAYVFLKILLVGCYLRAYRHDAAARALSGRFIAGYAASAACWSASLLVPTPARPGVWMVGLLVEMAAPVIAWRQLRGRATAHAGHIAERFGLFTIIVLGEAVVAVASGTAGTDWAPRSALVAAGGFAVAACLWWIYFGFADAGTFRAVLRQGQLPGFAYGYGHLPLFIGLAAMGAGVRLAIEGAGDPALGAGARVALCGGVALCLAAISLIQAVTRRSAHDRVVVARLGVAAGALALAALGRVLPPLPLVGLLAGSLVALTCFEIAQAGVRAAPVEHGRSPAV